MPGCCPVLETPNYIRFELSLGLNFEDIMFVLNPKLFRSNYVMIVCPMVCVFC